MPIIGILITILVALLYIYQPSWIRTLNSKLYDTVLENGHNASTKGVVAIVDIDEKSLQQYGQWPWPRYRMALLLKNLQQAGVLGVGLDILFAEPDRTSPAMLRQDLQKDLGVQVDFSGLPEALLDNDRIFAKTLQEGPFVLGFYFDFEGIAKRTSVVVKDLNPAVVSRDLEVSLHGQLFTSEALLQPLPNLAKAAVATGFINTIRDRDGVLRSSPVIMAYEDKVYANLGLVTLWIALGKPPTIVKASANGTESIRLGQTTIPLDNKGRVWLHYRGKKQTFPYYSAADILSGAIKQEELQGKIILVGTSAVGLHDLRTTPLDDGFPGVEAHATLIDNILTGDFIQVPDWLPGMEICLTVVAGLVTTFLVYLLSAWFILPIVLIFGGACWYGSMWIFATKHFFFSPLFPILSTGLNFSVLGFLKFLRSDQEKRYIRGAFSRYVSSNVVDKIVASPDQLKLEGEEKEVSILFSDIRGFTTMSEKLTPDQVSALLKSYLTPMTRTVIEHNGTLDKFIGDAVMAFWNAPVEVPNHRFHAVSTGLAMLEALPELNRGFAEEYGLTIQIGIGIHAGKASVGNMGSEDLFDYTVIGDNVNLASRLEGLTKFYGVPIIVSDALQDVQVDGYTRQELDKVTVKGKEEPVTLFTLCKEALLAPEELACWQAALGMYRERSFQQAISELDGLIQRCPDIHVYRIYRERCSAFMENPPGDDWQCVYSHVTK